jgi:hypothetical protein
MDEPTVVWIPVLPLPMPVEPKSPSGVYHRSQCRRQWVAVTAALVMGMASLAMTVVRALP